jgi:signal transduction histidine kinase
MATTPEKGRRLAAGLERALALVDDAVAGANLPGAARAQARAHALTLFEACGASSDAVPLVLLGYAAELLCVIAVDLAANPREAKRLIEQIEDHAGVPQVALGREVLQAARQPELPVDIAIEVRLSLLLAFADAEALTLWTRGPTGELKLASQAGDYEPESGSHREVARQLLDSQAPRSVNRPSMLAIRIERLRPPAAALVADGIDRLDGGAPLLFDAAAPVLSALLDREALLAREHSTQETVVGAIERRLARLRFDLHDGPQQDVHLLAQDLGLFREQLRPMIAGDENAGRLLGRLDDLEAMLVALDGDLRRLSTSVQSPFLTPGSLPEALRQLTDGFAARTGVQPETHIGDGMTELTDSQQITLLSLIRESLSNIRKHSDARHVTITITASGDGVHAQITDDGTGFEPETMLVQAARAGRLGLVGMHERVRMLGGRTQIDSRPGGPTVISATLPPWPGDREP